MPRPGSGTVPLFRHLRIDVLNAFAQPREFIGEVVAEDQAQEHLGAIIAKKAAKLVETVWYWELRIDFECQAPGTAQSAKPIQGHVQVKVDLQRSPKIRHVIVAGLLQRAADPSASRNATAGDTPTGSVHPVEAARADSDLAFWLHGSSMDPRQAELFVRRVLYRAPAATGSRTHWPAGDPTDATDVRIDDGRNHAGLAFESIRLEWRGEVFHSHGFDAERDANQELANWIANRPAALWADPILVQAMLRGGIPLVAVLRLGAWLGRSSIRNMLIRHLWHRRHTVGLTQSHAQAVAWITGCLEGTPVLPPMADLPVSGSRRCKECKQCVTWRLASAYGQTVVVLGAHSNPDAPTSDGLCRGTYTTYEDLDPILPWPLRTDRASARTFPGRASWRAAVIASAPDNLVDNPRGNPHAGQANPGGP